MINAAATDSVEMAEVATTPLEQMAPTGVMLDIEILEVPLNLDREDSGLAGIFPCK